MRQLIQHCLPIPKSAAVVWLLLLAIVYGGLICWSCVVHSPPIDETAHLPAGLSHLESGRVELYVVNPPLVRILAAIPVWWLSPEYDWSAYKRDPGLRSEFQVGRDFVRANGPRMMLYYRVARLSLLPFGILGLVALFRTGTSLRGLSCGLTAAILSVVNPDMLAHSSLMTPDAWAAVAGILFAAFVAHQRAPLSWKIGLVTGAAAAYVVCTKSTWGVVLPFVLIVMLWGQHERGTHWLCLLPYLLAGLTAFVLMIHAIYGFDGAFPRLEDCQLESQSFGQWDGAGKNAAQEMQRTSLSGSLRRMILPLPKAFVEGIDVQKGDFERGFRSYLMGEWKHGGWWYYFLVGFLVKEPIGFQLMLYVSILHGLWNWRRWTKESFREWSLIVLPPVLIFGLVSSQTGFSHHMRYVLPAYPFLFIIAARTVTLGRFWKSFSYACLIWQAAAVLWFAPHWMSYFNEFAGGPKNGHKWLVNSNIDWGQDILMLKWWQDKHPEATPLHAALYTGFDPKDIGLKFQLPAPFVKSTPYIVSKEGLRGPQPGWYAVSVCMLKGQHFNVPEGNGEWSYSTENFTYFLDHFEPVDRIGYSIYIYHISEADAARVREQLLSAEQEERAVSENR